MADLVYILCAVASLGCTWLLWRGWRRSGARLLMWSALAFLGLFLNNVLLILDVRVFPEVDLAIVRLVPAVLGILAMLYGLIWDSE